MQLDMDAENRDKWMSDAQDPMPFPSFEDDNFQPCTIWGWFIIIPVIIPTVPIVMPIVIPELSCDYPTYHWPYHIGSFQESNAP